MKNEKGKKKNVALRFQPFTFSHFSFNPFSTFTL